jgi:hypothetical protein
VSHVKSVINSKYNRCLFAEKGRKFTKIVNGCSVYCFVDNSNGDVLKAASWKKPAPHARSNIFAPDFGLSGVNEYGANYLR